MRLNRDRKGPQLFAKYRSETLKAAVQLGYGPEVQDCIRNATTEGEVIRAMIWGRHKLPDDTLTDVCNKARA